MKIDGNIIEFFDSMPNELLTKLAIYDRDALERICVALTLDIQLLKEEIEREKIRLAS
jgi:hypothetical protein